MSKEESLSFLLVIDISEKDYKSLKHGHIPLRVLNVITKGIPLDNIRAEIAEEHNDYVVNEQYDTAYGLELALMIIDKYKGESENK